MKGVKERRINVIFSKIKGVYISEHKGHKELSSMTPYGEYLNPEYVYIPLVEQDTVCEALVNVGDKVKLGQLIAMKKGRFSSPIHASVSGEVVAIDTKMWHSSGRMVPTIQIKNDFLETKVESIKENNVSELTSEQIIEKIRDCGIVGLGGSGFPAYVKYMGNCPIDTVIINAVECEPYISDNYTIMKNQMDELISGIKFIMRAVDAHKAFLAIKKNKVELIKKMQPYFDAEPDINMFFVKDEYPAGWEKYLVQRIVKKTYNNLPSEVGAVVNNAATALAIYRAVTYNMPLVEKMITISGRGLKNPQNVYVKIGTKLNDIIKSMGGYTDDLGEAYFIAGGPMTGKSIPFDSMVVNSALTSVIVMPKLIDDTVYSCLGCGKCVENCPAFLSPVQIKNALDAGDKELLKEYHAEKCMQCGLCSYICPSRIELTESVAKAKALLLKR